MHSRNIGYIARLDHLRFIAAFIVLMFHASIFYHKPGSIPIPILDRGYVGVSLFMVLSGMILTLITLDKEVSTRRFYVNRVLRIYPLFVFVATAGYFSTPDPRATTVSVDYLISLLPFSNLSRMNYGVFGGHLWSVMVEMQFYLLFPVLAFMLKVRGVRFYAAVIALLIIIRLSIFVLNGTIYHMAYFSIFGSLDIFLIGCIAGILYRKSEQVAIPRYAWIAIFVGFNVVIATMYRLGFSEGSLFWVVWPDLQAVIWAAFVIAYLRGGTVLWSGVWSYLGKISYSLYAWHILAWMVVVHFWPEPFVSPYVTAALIVLPVTVGLAALSYYVIEAPFLMLRSRYIAR